MMTAPRPRRLYISPSSPYGADRSDPSFPALTRPLFFSKAAAFLDWRDANRTRARLGRDRMCSRFASVYVDRLATEPNELLRAMRGHMMLAFTGMDVHDRMKRPSRVMLAGNGSRRSSRASPELCDRDRARQRWTTAVRPTGCDNSDRSSICGAWSVRPEQRVGQLISVDRGRWESGEAALRHAGFAVARAPIVGLDDSALLAFEEQYARQSDAERGDLRGRRRTAAATLTHGRLWQQQQ